MIISKAEDVTGFLHVSPNFSDDFWEFPNVFRFVCGSTQNNIIKLDCVIMKLMMDNINIIRELNLNYLQYDNNPHNLNKSSSLRHRINSAGNVISVISNMSNPVENLKKKIFHDINNKENFIFPLQKKYDRANILKLVFAL